MIDWLSGKIVFHHTSEQLPSGSVVSVDSDGSIEWKTNKRIQVKGSYDSNFTLRTDPSSEYLPGMFRTLEFSGNPVKFIQGHNVWGSSDLTGLAFESITKALNTLGLKLHPAESKALFGGNFTLSRVDINQMFAMGSIERVNQWLHSAEFSARTRQGKGHFAGNTLYFQKKSTRWSLKFYSKGLEILASGHQLPREFLHAKSFHEYASDKLRAELTLRTKELKKLGLDKGSSWGDNEHNEIFFEYLGRLEMSEQKELDDLVLTLPNELRSTYLTWKTGYDVKSIINKRTFYRHRKRLLGYGVDISIPSGNKVNNVIPLMRIIEAIPADIPEWAYGTDYYFEPRKAL
jgi:II/X family phage/plasmid replication protein|tara:strand:- start:109 stop:1146 length:1038 start_codon:yes stop_codon:yes gene_type:complete